LHKEQRGKSPCIGGQWLPPIPCVGKLPAILSLHHLAGSLVSWAFDVIQAFKPPNSARLARIFQHGDCWKRSIPSCPVALIALKQKPSESETAYDWSLYRTMGKARTPHSVSLHRQQRHIPSNNGPHRFPLLLGLGGCGCGVRQRRFFLILACSEGWYGPRGSSAEGLAANRSPWTARNGMAFNFICLLRGIFIWF